MNLYDLFRRLRNEIRVVRPAPQYPRAVPPPSNQATRVVQAVKAPAVHSVPRNNPGHDWRYRVLPKDAINIPNIKYHLQPEPDLDVCIVELKAQIHKIYDQYNTNKKVVRYLSFPCTIFLIINQNQRLAAFYNYFSPNPINGLQSPVHFPCLSNTDSVGMVCYGTEREWYEVNSRVIKIPSLKGKIVEVVEEYWRTAFTNHLAQTHMVPWGKIDPRIASFEKWEITTQKYPDFIFDVPWHRRTAGTIEYLLNDIWRQ
jgi:hypothetical protein